MLQSASLLDLLRAAPEHFAVAYARAKVQPLSPAQLQEFLPAVKALAEADPKWAMLVQLQLAFPETVTPLWFLGAKSGPVLLRTFINHFLNSGLLELATEALRQLSSYFQTLPGLRETEIASLSQSLALLLCHKHSPFRKDLFNNPTVLHCLGSLLTHHGGAKGVLASTLQAVLGLFEVGKQLMKFSEVRVSDPQSVFGANPAYTQFIKCVFSELVKSRLGPQHLYQQLAVLEGGVGLAPLYPAYSQFEHHLLLQFILPVLNETRTLQNFDQNPSEYVYRDLDLAGGRQSQTCHTAAAGLLFKLAKTVDGCLPRTLDWLLAHFGQEEELVLLCLAILADCLAARRDQVAKLQALLGQAKDFTKYKGSFNTMRKMLFLGKLLPILFQQREDRFMEMLGFLLGVVAGEANSAIKLLVLEQLEDLLGDQRLAPRVEGCLYDIAHGLIKQIGECQLPQFMHFMANLIRKFGFFLERYSSRLASACIERVCSEVEACLARRLRSSLMLCYSFDLLEVILGAEGAAEEVLFIQSELEKLRPLVGVTAVELGQRMISLAAVTLQATKECYPFIREVLALEGVAHQPQLYSQLLWSFFSTSMLQLQQKTSSQQAVRLALRLLDTYHCGAVKIQFEYKPYYQLCLVVSMAVVKFNLVLPAYTDELLAVLLRGVQYFDRIGKLSSGLGGLISLLLYYYPERCVMLHCHFQFFARVEQHLQNVQFRFQRTARLLFYLALAHNFNRFGLVGEGPRQPVLLGISEKIAASLAPLQPVSTTLQLFLFQFGINQLESKFASLEKACEPEVDRKALQALQMLGAPGETMARAERNLAGLGKRRLLKVAAR